MSVRIIKARIKKDLFLDAEYIRNNPDGTSHQIKIISTQVIHDDLRESFSAMDTILARVCDLWSVEEGNLELADIKFTGYSKSGSGDTEGITLTGTRRVPHGTMNIVSPYMELCDLTEDDIAVLDHCMNEVYMYLFEDKHQPSDQLELNFDQYDMEIQDALK